MVPHDEGGTPPAAGEQEQEGPVIRNRRRIDPETGQVRPDSEREPASPAPSAPAGEQPGQDAVGEDVATQLAERTADLQRLQAEYANYRKRVDRDRVAVREQALANVMSELLPVLDDIGRAREHGELTGGFKSVAESLETIVTKLGLTRYGEKGEAFDPMVHEALMHTYSPDVTESVCMEILQPGYRVADRIVRPARVTVAEPGQPEQAEPTQTPDEVPEGATVNGGAREAKDDESGDESRRDDQDA